MIINMDNSNSRINNDNSNLNNTYNKIFQKGANDTRIKDVKNTQFHHTLDKQLLPMLFMKDLKPNENLQYHHHNHNHNYNHNHQTHQIHHNNGTLIKEIDSLPLSDRSTESSINFTGVITPTPHDNSNNNSHNNNNNNTPNELNNIQIIKNKNPESLITSTKITQYTWINYPNDENIIEINFLEDFFKINKHNKLDYESLDIIECDPNNPLRKFNIHEHLNAQLSKYGSLIIDNDKYCGNLDKYDQEDNFIDDSDDVNIKQVPVGALKSILEDFVCIKGDIKYYVGHEYFQERMQAFNEIDTAELIGGSNNNNNRNKPKRKRPYNRKVKSQESDEQQQQHSNNNNNNSAKKRNNHHHHKSTIVESQSDEIIKHDKVNNEEELKEKIMMKKKIKKERKRKRVGSCNEHHEDDDDGIMSMKSKKKFKSIKDSPIKDSPIIIEIREAGDEDDQIDDME